MKVPLPLLFLVSILALTSAQAQLVNVADLEARVGTNDPEAELELGRAYHLGNRGVPKDYQKAAELYRKAAAQGNAKAMYNLGYIYHFGQGVVPDDVTANQWYQKSADAGLPAGELEIGLACFHGDSGQKQDFAAALKWLTQASQHKEEPAVAGSALNGLGSLYENGWEVQRDPAKAVALYKEAAEMDDTKAQANLGQVYDEGVLVRRDPVEAFVWYRLAAAKGDQLALHSLTEFLEGSKLTPAQMDEANKRANAFRSAHHKPLLTGPPPTIIIPGELPPKSGPASVGAEQTNAAPSASTGAPSAGAPGH